MVIVRMEGKSKKGRPWKNGPDKVEEDTKANRIGNWHAVARNWEEWRKLILEAKVHDRMGCWRKSIRRRGIKKYLNESNLRITHYR